MFQENLSAAAKCLIESTDNETIVLPSKLQIELQKEHFSLKWSSNYIFCSLSGLKTRKKFQIKNVLLVSTDNDKTGPNIDLPKIPVHYFPANISENQDSLLAVCVKPFHYNFNRALWLVEFIEMYRIQGANHFYFYNHTVGPEVEAVLRHYNQMGILTLLHWNLPLLSQKQIRTEAMFSAMNDCNLRSVNRFKLLGIKPAFRY